MRQNPPVRGGLQFLYRSGETGALYELAEHRRRAEDPAHRGAGQLPPADGGAVLRGCAVHR